MTFRRASRAAAVALAASIAAGCGPRYQGPPPAPLALTRPAPPIFAEPCEPSGELPSPTGRTPAPEAQGELRFIDVRGDDRLAFAGGFLPAWLPASGGEAERLLMATPEGVLLWTVPGGQLERRVDLGGGSPRIESIEVSPDGKWVGVSGATRPPGASVDAPVAWLLSMEGDLSIKRFDGVGGPLRFTPDGRRMFAPIHTWDLSAGTHAAVMPLDHEWIGFQDGQRALVFVQASPSPSPSYIPELRDAASGRVLRRFPAIDSSIRASVSTDGRRIALLRGGLTVFSSDTFEEVASIPAADLHGAGMVHLSSDGRLAVVETLMCGSFEGSGEGKAPECPPHLAVWDLERRARVFQSERGAGEGWIFTPDGRYLTGPNTRLVDSIIRVSDGAVLTFGSRIRSISPDSRWVVFERASSIDVAPLEGAGPSPLISRGPRVLARSADGALVAAVGQDGLLRIEGRSQCVRVGLRSAGRSGDPRPHEYFEPNGAQLAFSPDGALLFFSSGSGSSPRFRAISTKDGAERWSIAASQGQGGAWILPRSGHVVFQAYMHPDVLRFDMLTGAELPVARAPRLGYATPARSGLTYDVRDPSGKRASNLFQAAGTRDGRYVATSNHVDNNFSLSVWDLRDPLGVTDTPAGGWPIRLAISPDERLWAAGMMEGRIRLFPRTGGAPIDVQSTSRDRIVAMAFTPSGDRLVSAADDGALLLIDPSSGAVVGRARLPLDRPVSIWISPDGLELWVETARSMRARFRIGPAASAAPRPSEPAAPAARPAAGGP